MILADTNVLSQMTRPGGDLGVVAWIDRYEARLYLPSIVISELLFGAHKLEDELQRERLLTRTEAMLARFASRIVPFDQAEARVHAKLAGELRRRGITIGGPDGIIAATALCHGALLATRNVRDFAPTGVRVVDPWAERPASA